MVQGKFLTKHWLMNGILVVLGPLVTAIGYAFFIVPHQIVDGGVYAISMIIHYVLGTPTGMTALVLNIPLILWGIKELGPKFGLKTVVGLFLTSTFIDLFSLLSTHIHGAPDVPLASDPLLSAIYGGVFVGAGLGLIFRAKATTGGTDIVANIIAKHTSIPVGQAMMICDGTVVLGGMLFFGNPQMVLYAIITIFITGKVIDTVIAGVGYYKVVLIVSEAHEEIKEKILKDLQRGGTYLLGQGMYSEAPKKVIYCAVNRRELTMLQEFVSEIDPKAFLTILETRDILGEGFKSLQKV